jgi:hypothetical protein
MKPSGGTELQENFLTKNVDKKLLDKFQICTSVPEKIPLAKDKINILWQKNAPNQPNIEPWFSDLTIIKSMIGMFLIHIGIMKNIDICSMCLHINVML